MSLQLLGACLCILSRGRCLDGRDGGLTAFRLSCANNSDCWIVGLLCSDRLPCARLSAKEFIRCSFAFAIRHLSRRCVDVVGDKVNRAEAGETTLHVSALTNASVRPYCCRFCLRHGLGRCVSPRHIRPLICLTTTKILPLFLKKFSIFLFHQNL